MNSISRISNIKHNICHKVLIININMQNAPKTTRGFKKIDLFSKGKWTISLNQSNLMPELHKK